MLLSVADWLVYQLAGFDPESRLGGAVHFFVYDLSKIFLLLAVMVFAIGVLRTWLPDDQLRRWMAGRGLWGNIVAALFGAITPFCSCSSIPIFISLLKAGVPLGVTFSFLVTSPLINEYLAVLMAAEFGIPVTIAYVCGGLLIGTSVGVLIGRLRLEGQLEQDVLAQPYNFATNEKHTWASRLRFGWDESVMVIRQVWLWLVVGVAVGAFIHNYVPQEAVQSAVGAAGVFGVPLATILGVPMYGSCAAIVPVAVVLFEKGIPLGTALSFMMAMAALSLPEAIMLRRVMRLPLIALFFGATTLAIILIGYALNALEPILAK
jgi:uncharacterized membrane protein YraQ (UPF0718 family)